LKKTLKPFGKVARKLVVSAVDVNTGKYVTFDESTPFEDVSTVVAASSSIPFLFPPTKYGEHLFMDGGPIWNTNMVSAVEKCKELGFTEGDIILDILLLNQPKLSKEERKNNLTSIENFFRHREINGYFDTLSDVESFRRAMPTI
jgi:predicted acylesterase/phospholipase RssA